MKKKTTLHQTYTQTIIKSIIRLSEECDNVIVITLFDSIIDEFLHQSVGKKIVNTRLNISPSSKIIVNKWDKGYKAKVDNVIFTGLTRDIPVLDHSIGGRNAIVVSPIKPPRISLVSSYDMNDYDLIVSKDLLKFLNFKRKDGQIISRIPAQAAGMKCLVLSHYPIDLMSELFTAASIDFCYDMNQGEYLDENSIKRIEQQLNATSGASVNIDYLHDKTWVNKIKIGTILDALLDTGQITRGLNRQNLQYYYSSINPFNYQKLIKWGMEFSEDSNLYQDMKENNGKALESFIQIKVSSHCLSTGDKAVLYLSNVQTIDLKPSADFGQIDL